MVALWDIERGRVVRSLGGRGVPEAICAVRFSPDGPWLVSGEGDTVKLWNIGSGREVRSFTSPPYTHIAFRGQSGCSGNSIFS